MIGPVLILLADLRLSPFFSDAMSVMQCNGVEQVLPHDLFTIVLSDLCWRGHKRQIGILGQGKGM